MNFTNGFAVTGSGSTVTVDGSGFLHTSGTETALGDKTFSGNTTFSGTVTNSNATTTGTNTSIATGNGLSSGQALNVNAGSSPFATGSGAGRGFFYLGSTGGQTGAVTISDTGAFTGTLVALTADGTTSGTVLGISAQSLTSGKAIDVMLGTLYSGTSDAQGTIGAVNVRAQSFTGNVFNVSANGAGGASANLANFQSTQLAGNVVKVSGTSLTTGTALDVLLGTTGTGEIINTSAGYTGTLLSLQVNGSAVFSVNQNGTVTGPAAVGATWTIDNGNASAINIGTTTATTVTIGRSGQTQALAGNATVAGTLGVTGDVAVNTNKFTVAAATGNTAIAGTLGVTGNTTLGGTLGVTGNTTLGGTLGVTGATTLGSTLGVTGATTLGSTLGVTGDVSVNTGKFTITAASGNTSIAGTLGVTGNTTLGGTLGVTGDVSVNTNKFTVAAATGNTAIAGTLGVTGNTTLGGTLGVTGNTTLSGTLGVTGATTLSSTLGVTGNVTVNGGKLTIAAATGNITGPTTGAWTIDNGNASAINIGTTTATGITLGRTGQTLTVNSNTQQNGTLTVGSGGTAITQILMGTCSITSTSITGNAVGATNCAPGVDLATNNFAVYITPQTAIPTTLTYSIASVTTTNIVIQWSKPSNGNQATGAITFNWVAVR